MHMKQLDQAFAALADPTRRGIVVHLARGEASVSELVGRFSLTQPTISSHLKVLESAGLISRRREAQLRPCNLVPERLKAVIDWLEQVQEIWEGNFKRLDALLTELRQAEKKERKKCNPPKQACRQIPKCWSNAASMHPSNWSGGRIWSRT